MQSNSNSPTVFHWSLVLVEVIFLADGEAQVLKTQFTTKALTETFPAHRIKQLQNAAILQVQQNTQGNGVCKEFQAMDVYLLGLVPLGWMSDEQFMAKGGTVEQPSVDGASNDPGASIGQALLEGAQAALAAEGSLTAPDALAHLPQRPLATVHTLRPNPHEEALAPTREVETEADSNIPDAPAEPDTNDA